jgi:hypothetical protein
MPSSEQQTNIGGVEQLARFYDYVLPLNGWLPTSFQAQLG